ncbi:MAG: hypothetical protein AAGI38_06290 [Bacteroidota bacterium]
MTEKTRKRILIAIGSLALVAVGLQLIGSKYAGPFVANKVARWVAGATKNQYQFTCEKARLSLLSGKFELVKPALYPSSEWKDSTISSVAIEADQLKLLINDVWGSWNSKQLALSNLFLDRPEFHIYHRNSAQDSIPKLKESNLPHIFLEKIEVADGILHYHSPNDDLNQELTITHIQLLAEDIYLSDTAEQSASMLPIMVASIDVNAKIDKYRWTLPDSSYEVQVNRFAVSTQDSNISVGGIGIRPVKVGKPWHFDLPEVRVNGVNFGSLLSHRELSFRQISILQPYVQLRLATNQVHTRNLPSLHELHKKWFGALSPFLRKVEVGQLQLAHAKFAQFNQQDSLPQIRLEDASVVLEDVRLDSIFRPKKLFLSENIEAGIAGLKVHLPEAKVNFRLDSLSLSSKSRVLLAKGVKLTSGKRQRRGDVNRFVSEWQNLVCYGVDIESIWFDRVMGLDSVVIQQPALQMQGFPVFQRQDVDRLTSWDIYPAIQPFLDTLKVRSFLIKDGITHLNVGDKNSSTAFKASDIQVAIQELEVNKGAAKRKAQLFYAKDIDVNLDIQDYTFMLPDSSHTLTINKLGLSMEDSLVYADSLVLRPTASRKKDTTRHQYDLFVPKLELTGLQGTDLYFDRVLSGNSLRMAAPNFRLQLPMDPRTSASSFEIDSLYRYVKDIFTEISLGKVSIEDAKLNLQRRKVWHYQLPSCSGLLTGFQLDSLSTMSADNFLFADDLEFQLDSLQVPLPDSLHQLAITTLRYGAKQQSLTLKSCWLIARPRREERGKRTTFSGFLPEIRATGVSPYSMYQRSDIQWQQLEFLAPSVEMHHIPQRTQQTLDSLAKNQRYLGLNRFFNSFSIEKLNLNEGSFSFLPYQGTEFLDAENITLNMYQARLDPVAAQHEEHLFSLGDVDLNFDIAGYELMLSDSSYELSFSGISLNTSTSVLLLDSVYLKPVKEQSRMVEVLAPQLELQGFDLTDWYMIREARLEAVRAIGAKVQYMTTDETSPSPRTQTGNWLTPDLYPYIEPFLDRLAISSLSAQQVQFERLHEGKRLYLIPDAELELEQFYLDQLGPGVENQYFFSKDMSCKLQRFSVPLEDSMYYLNIGGIEVKSCEKAVTLKEIELKPRYGFYEFGRVNGDITDRIDLLIPKVTLEQVNLPGLLAQDKLWADRIILNSPSLEVFRDKHRPDTLPRRPPTPQQALKLIPWDTRVDSLQVTKGSITYFERMPESSLPGRISFGNIEANLSPFTNQPILTPNKEVVVAELKSRLRIMDAGNITAVFRFDQQDKNDAFTLYGSADTMNLTALNPMLEPLLFMRVNQGKMDGMYFSVEANKEEASGKMRFRYRDLKVNVIDKGLVTFMANTFVLKSDNPNRRILRIGRIETPRDPGRSMFNFWGKIMLSGIMSSVGIKGQDEKVKGKFWR